MIRIYNEGYLKICRIVFISLLGLLQTGCNSKMQSLFNNDASMGCTGRTDWVVPDSQRTLSSNVYIEQIYVMHLDNPCTSAVNMDRAVEMAKKVNSLVNLLFSSSSSAFHLAGSFTLHPNGYVEVDFAPFLPLAKHDQLSGDRERFKQFHHQIDQLHISPSGPVAQTVVKLNFIYWIGPVKKRTRLPE